jgi:hypothetical protein
VTVSVSTSRDPATIKSPLILFMDDRLQIADSTVPFLYQLRVEPPSTATTASSEYIPASRIRHQGRDPED